jgi:hypothetical protein
MLDLTYKSDPGTLEIRASLDSFDFDVATELKDLIGIAITLQSAGFEVKLKTEDEDGKLNSAVMSVEMRHNSDEPRKKPTLSFEVNTEEVKPEEAK